MGLNAPRLLGGAESSVTRLLVLTSARNEETHVKALIDAVRSQSRIPDLWVIVDDASTDGTYEQLRRHAEGLEWVEVLRRRGARSGMADQLADGAPPRALNWALAHVERGDYTHIAKLDADVVLPGDFFERLLADFGEDASLGMTAGVLTELHRGVWRRVMQPRTHPPAPARMYSRACFHASGGFRERLGWDAMDEAYARMQGFSTRTNPCVQVRHMRPLGTADGRMRGRARHGECAWILHQPPLWVLLRACKIALTFSPRGLSGLAFVWGYARALVRSTPRVDDPAFRQFVRRDLRMRMTAPVTRLLSRGSAKQRGDR